MSTAFLITGATGKQGRATITSLLSHPQFSPSTHTIYALTRDATSASAQRLASSSPSIKLISGNLDDSSSIFKSLPRPPTGVFSLTQVGKNEAVQGKNLIDAAAATGTVTRYVQASVDRNGEHATNVPHFQTKHEIEQHLQKVSAAKGFKYTILRPVFFLDNLDWGFATKLITVVWRDVLGPRKLQVVDTKDIGKWAADALMGDASLENAKVSLVGDELSFEEANTIFKQETGQDMPTTWSFLGKLFLWASHDMNEMFKFFRDPGYAADVNTIKATGRPVTDLKTWVQRSSYAKKSQ